MTDKCIGQKGIDADFQFQIPQDADFPDTVTIERDADEVRHYQHPVLLDAVEQRLKNARDKIEQLSTEVTKLTEDNKWAGEQLMAKDKLITDLTNRIAQLMHELDSLQVETMNKLSKSRIRMIELEKEVVRLRDEIENDHWPTRRAHTNEIERLKPIYDAAVLVAAHGPNAFYSSENKSMLENLRDVIYQDTTHATVSGRESPNG